MASVHPPLSRRRGFARTARILLGAVAALALACVLFDWDWFRPALEHYLSRQSGRAVRADHLGLTGLLSLEPTVTLRGAYIQNAPWADSKQPMAVAGEAAFTFSIRSVIDGRAVISKIVLKDADVDMEKQADGLRNWRLKNPDDRGPAKIKVLRLEAHRTKLRFADRERDFDLRFTATDAGAAGVKARVDKPLVTRIDAQGVYRGAKFTAQADTGPVLTFRDTQDFFAARGHAVAGRTRLDLEGEAADMFVKPLLNAAVRVAGASLAELHPFIAIQPAHSRPYDFEAQVRRTQAEYRFEKLHGRVGETDLAGDAAHDLSDERHQWRANLRSASADFHDLASLAGVNYPSGSSASPDRIFPPQPVRTDRLRAQDMQLSLDAKKLSAPGMPALDSARFEAVLRQGMLAFKTLDLGIAGGHAAGEAGVDARKDVPHGHAVLRLTGLRLERLFPKLPPEARRTGPMHGTLSLEGTGGSLAAMLGAASGKLDLALDGGSISNRLDAKLSLNLGKMAGLFFKGDHDIPIYCAVAAFDFRSGSGKARALLVETEQTRIEGTGEINLRDEKPDLLLVPRPKNPGLLTLGATIRVGGTFRHPAFAFHEGKGGAPAVVSNAHCPGRPVASTAAR
jgi:uncharacterized protein involved in outer membrane biogenesis